ncbi:hypothetical protein FRB99_002202 [Tulasnella sp. 403]|nr:hypothetical protein FRB99_002202 [Tulasnella sp. 403]
MNSPSKPFFASLFPGDESDPPAPIHLHAATSHILLQPSASSASLLGRLAEPFPQHDTGDDTILRRLHVPLSASTSSLSDWYPAPLTFPNRFSDEAGAGGDLIGDGLCLSRLGSYDFAPTTTVDMDDNEPSSFSRSPTQAGDTFDFHSPPLGDCDSYVSASPSSSAFSPAPSPDPLPPVKRATSILSDFVPSQTHTPAPSLPPKAAKSPLSSSQGYAFDTRKRAYVCHCHSNSYKRKGDVIRHLKEHTLPEVCRGCSQGFRRKDPRIRHWDSDPRCEARHFVAIMRTGDDATKERERRRWEKRWSSLPGGRKGGPKGAGSLKNHMDKLVDECWDTVATLPLPEMHDEKDRKVSSSPAAKKTKRIKPVAATRVSTRRSARKAGSPASL